MSGVNNNNDGIEEIHFRNKESECSVECKTSDVTGPQAVYYSCVIYLCIYETCKPTRTLAAVFRTKTVKF